MLENPQHRPLHNHTVVMVCSQIHAHTLRPVSRQRVSQRCIKLLQRNHSKRIVNRESMRAKSNHKIQYLILQYNKIAQKRHKLQQQPKTQSDIRQTLTTTEQTAKKNKTQPNERTNGWNRLTDRVCLPTS